MKEFCVELWNDWEMLGARPGILQTIEHAPCASDGVRARREAGNPGFSYQTTLVFRHLNSSKKWNWIKTIENKNLYGENITSGNCLSDNVGFGWCSNLLLDKMACKLCARSWQVSLQQLTELRNGNVEMMEVYLASEMFVTQSLPSDHCRSREGDSGVGSC